MTTKIMISLARIPKPRLFRKFSTALRAALITRFSIYAAAASVNP
jgi:hypothetical protein